MKKLVLNKKEIKMIKINNFPIRTVLFVVLAIFPAVFTGFLIYTYSVNVPYWDQWAIAPLFEKFENGNLGFADLFAQHNESRKFFPRIIFIGLAYITNWNVRFEMLVIFLLASITSYNIYKISCKTVEGALSKKLGLMIFTNLLLFAPTQWENWLWGIQIVVFIPTTCITACIILAYSKKSTLTKFLLSAVLCTITTFSYANGLLAWFVVFPVLFLKSGFGLKKQIFMTAAWGFAFLLNFCAYFYNYHKPTHHPSFSEAVVNPIITVRYFLTFLGAPLGLGNYTSSFVVAPLVGSILVILLMGIALYLLRHWKNIDLLTRLAGWIGIAMYALLSALITTSGRVGFGVPQALSSRYTTFSVYLMIALLYIIIIVFNDIQKRGVDKKVVLTLSTVISLLGVSLIPLHFLTTTQAIETMRGVRNDRLAARACLRFVNILPSKCHTVTLFPSLEHLTKYSNSINSLGFLAPPLIQDGIITLPNVDANEGHVNYGFFDRVTRNDDGSYTATGWAVLPDKSRPACAVVLTYQISENEYQMFSLIVRINLERADVAKSLNNETYRQSGWQRIFSLPEKIIGNPKLVAWAYDSTTGKFHKLNGSHIINLVEHVLDS